MNLKPGTRLGDYRILSTIGRGAYGMVFEAEHVLTRRVDAVKVLYDSGPASADDEQRFLREIQVQASLRHPNIATVYTAFRTEWGLALAMEKVQGDTLAGMLARGRVPLQAGIRYTQQTLAALSCAGRRGIVHRDIKPENILVTQDGQVKITDFGLAYFRGCARITSPGENLGTPCYMAPEQVKGTEPVDARTDVYATAVVLYEIATGKPPFSGSNGFAVMLAHQNTPPAPPIEANPSIGPKLNQVILTALEKNPGQRFQDAAQFSRALAEASAEVAAVKPAEQAAPVRRPMRIWASAAAALVICGAGMVWMARGTLRGTIAAPHPRAIAVPAPTVAPPALPVVAPAPPPVVVEPVSPDPEPVAAPIPHRSRRRKAAAASLRAAPANTAPVISFQPVPPPPAKSAAIPLGSAPPPPVEAEGTAPATSSGELPASAPADPPAPPSSAAQAPAADPAAPGKRPNVLKRAIDKIFRKSKREAASGESH